MFKLKLWLTPLIFLVAGALLVVLGTTFLHERLLPPYEFAIQHAKIGLKGQLQTDATRAVNHAANLTDRPEVRAALSGDEGGGEGEAAPASLDGVLSAVPEGMRAPAFGVIANASGKVVAHEGGNPLGDAIQGLPEFAEAMTGVVRDGFGTFGGKPFHLASAPVVEGGKAVGAVVMGWPLDAAYADRLSETLKLPVVLLTHDGQRLGKSFPKMTAEQAKVARIDGVFGALELDLPVDLPLPFLVPEAKRWQAGAVTTVGPRSPALVVAVDRTPALKTLAWAQVWVAGIAVLLAVLLMFLVMSLQRSISKPMDVIMDHLSAFAQGSAVGILPEAALKGPFVRLGKQINMILQAPPPGSAPRSGVSPVAPAGNPGLDIGGGAPPPPPSDDSSELEQSFPGVPSPPAAGGPPAAGAPPPPPPEDMAEPAPGPGAEGPPPFPADPNESSGIAPVSAPPVSDKLGESALSGLFEDGSDDPLAAFRVGGNAPSGPQPPAQPPPQAAPPPSPPAATAPPQPLPGMGSAPPQPPPPQPPPPQSQPPQPPPQAAGQAPAGDPNYNPDATVMFQVPQELIQESAQQSGGGPAVGGGAPPPPTPQPPAEDRTVVAQVPSELLSAAAPRHSVSAEENAHYRDVFQEFINTRQQCGEDTDQLTYDRFVAKLMKNRQQIIEKYNSKSVRFQVYVKQGKAALRAVPVRE